MLSLQVCFRVPLASCLSSLHSYWAFSFLWELLLNTESQWITKAPSSYIQSRTWLWIEGKPLLRATTFRAKINDQQQIQLLVKGEGPSLLPWLFVVWHCSPEPKCVSVPPAAQLCLQGAWALGLWLEADGSHSSQQIPTTRVCSHLLHTAQWPRERDVKIKLFLDRPTKNRHSASDIPTAVRVLRELECDQQHMKTCVWEHNFQNFDLSCNRKDLLWNIFHVQ